MGEIPLSGLEIPGGLEIGRNFAHVNSSSSRLYTNFHRPRRHLLVVALSKEEQDAMSKNNLRGIISEISAPT